MFSIIFGTFLVLHGLVHLLYVGQSARYFELQPGLVWPDRAWAFSRFSGDETIRTVASVFLILATIGFVAGGAGLLTEQAWWRFLVTGSALFSAVIFILLWDGIPQRLADKGSIGILINMAILVILFAWPGV